VFDLSCSSSDSSLFFEMATNYLYRSMLFKVFSTKCYGGGGTRYYSKFKVLLTGLFDLVVAASGRVWWTLLFTY